MDATSIDHNPINGEYQSGRGSYHLTQRGGKRCSSTIAHTEPALDRPNLTAETEAPTTRIRFNGDRAVDVACEQTGETRTAKARSEGVLSAGAFNSPQLSILSGIGPVDHLRDHDITVYTDNPGVGVNLQDHLRLGVACEQSSGQPAPAPTSNVVEMGCFVRTDDPIFT